MKPITPNIVSCCSCTTAVSTVLTSRYRVSPSLLYQRCTRRAYDKTPLGWCVVIRRCNYGRYCERSNQRHHVLRWKFSGRQWRLVCTSIGDVCHLTHRYTWTKLWMKLASTRHTWFHSTANSTPGWYKKVSQTAFKFWCLVDRGQTISVLCICTMVVTYHRRGST